MKYYIKLFLLTIIIILCISNNYTEGFGTGIDGEALRNIASLYNTANSTLKVKNLEATGNITSTGGNITTTGNIQSNGTLNVHKSGLDTSNLKTNDFPIGTLAYGFSHNMNGMADYIHMSNWVDDSGGNANTIALKKNTKQEIAAKTDAPGMRLIHTSHNSVEKIHESNKYQDVLTVNKDNLLYTNGKPWDKPTGNWKKLPSKDPPHKWETSECGKNQYVCGIGFGHNSGQDYAYQEKVIVKCCNFPFSPKNVSTIQKPSYP